MSGRQVRRGRERMMEQECERTRESRRRRRRSDYGFTGVGREGGEQENERIKKRLRVRSRKFLGAIATGSLGVYPFVVVGLFLRNCVIVESFAPRESERKRRRWRGEDTFLRRGREEEK